MAGVCSYQSQDPYYQGRDVNNYCSFTNDGQVEPFGTNRYVASWRLASLGMRDQAQAINRELRVCLDQHNAQALSLHVGGMGNVTGEYDVTCPDPDSAGLSGYNVQVTGTYTIQYEAGLQCNGSNPVAVIKSLLKFHEGAGLDPECLEANSTRFVVMDSSTPGTSGILRAGVEKCIGLVTNLTDWLSSLPSRSTYYLEEYRCQFSENQTRPIPTPSFNPVPIPTPMPSFSPVPVPTSMPSFNPVPVPTSMPSFNPVPVPTSMPSFSPVPVPTPMPSFSPVPVPTPMPSFSPIPVPTSMPSFSPVPVPTSMPSFSPVPFPTSMPSFNPVPAPTLIPSFSPVSAPTQSPIEDNSMMLIVIIVVSVAMVIFIGYVYRRCRSREQLFVGAGPEGLEREQLDEEPITSPLLNRARVLQTFGV